MAGGARPGGAGDGGALRVLVTGVAGFIAPWVARSLLARGHDVFGTFRGIRALPEDLVAHPRFRALVADLDEPRDAAKLIGEVGAEIAVHMAWYAEPTTYLRSPQNMDALGMTVRLARLLYGAGCTRFVGAGSCAEYAAKSDRLAETDPCAPRSVYGAAKLAARTAIEALAEQEGKSFAWGRIFHLHGPGDAPERLVPSIVRKLRQGVAVDLTDGTQIRDHLHVADVGAALAAIAVSDANGVVNVCSGDPVTLRHVVELVANAVGRPDLLRFGALPHRPGETMFLAGDAARLRSLGWSPRWALEDGLRDAVAASRLSSS
jgi:nucleoside-diphosphate-sugar epimerase